VIASVLMAAVALIAIIAVAGCGGGGSSSGGTASAPSGEPAGKPQEGGTLELSQGEEIGGMNPAKEFLPEDVNVMAQMFETLWKEDKGGKIVPWLIESAKATNQDKLWTLQLKKGIKFSSGQPMTSADVKWTLERDFEAEAYAPLMEVFEKVEAPSADSIVIKLKEPRPELPIIMTQWTFSVMPKNWGGVSEEEFDLHPVGTGPFKFVSWKKGESITMEKNPYYWRQGLPHLQQVVFRTVQSPNSRVSELRGGALEAIYAPPFQELESLEEGETEVGEFGEGLVYVLNLNREVPLFQNAKVREAVNLGINRTALNEAGLTGRGEPAASYVPPTAVGNSFNSDLKPAEQNVEKAQQLLAEAVKEGVDPSFTLLVPAETPFWANGVQVVQANLEEVGFKVSIKKTDNGTAVALAEEGNYDALALYGAQQVLSPVEVLGFYVGVKAFWTNAPTDVMGKLFVEAQAETNEQKRDEIWHHMQQIIYEENTVIPTVYANYIWAFSNEVSGFWVAPTGVLYLEEASL
jgi:peptide/nickel transport system substrate-binding protein